ncbi:hypothetical protein IE81DRAFT_367710 [Ceraceosorus guamensis]|uniref:Anaphase-promoting complex subunit 1 N-terminal domain-containing protein n=1 Tax=Ceraceosorus guamensis TaxID=1522189 RepID=A0A316VW29_9BASI|nr:hypothetical protein IE81DRAFT_367710 [Ceraceosorus guamensis]PWN41148.1 hypothetical protein IE81DRAFT_367710 [Ceraceosorus guamensis]
MQSMGEVLCWSAAKSEQAKLEYKTAQHIQHQLQQVLPPPRNSSSVLSRLQRSPQVRRRASIAGASDQGISSDPLSRSNQSSSGGRFHSREVSEGKVVQTELVWKGKRLVWSAGGRLVRQFTYDDEVLQACWAWMNTADQQVAHEGLWPSSDGKGRDQTENQTASSGSGLLGAVDDLLSPAQKQFRKVPPQRKAANTLRQCQRALCVFMPSTLLLYFPDTGAQQTVAVPFELRAVFPARTGLFITREQEKEDERRAKRARADAASSRSTDEQPLASLFYISRLFQEWVPVEKHGDASSSFNELNEEVIFVGAEDTPSGQSWPMLVTVSREHHRVRIYSYHVALRPRVELMDASDNGVPGKLDGSAGATSAAANTSQRPSYTRAPSSRADLTFQQSHASIGQGRPSQAPQSQARASQASIGQGRPSTRARLSSIRVPSRARGSSQRVTEDLVGLLNGPGNSVGGPPNGQPSLLPDAVGTTFSAGGPAANTRLRRASQTQHAMEMSVAARTPFTNQRTTSRQVSSRVSVSRGRSSINSTRQADVSALLDLGNQSDAAPAISTQTQRQTLLPTAPRPPREEAYESEYPTERACVALLDEIPLDHWDSDTTNSYGSTAFVIASGICIVIPAAKRIIIRQARTNQRGGIDLHNPAAQWSNSPTDCIDACAVGENDGLAILHRHYIQWYPDALRESQSISVKLDVAAGQPIRLQPRGKFCVEVTVLLNEKLLAQSVTLFRSPSCSTTTRVLDALRLALPAPLASHLISRWNESDMPRGLVSTSSDWHALLELLAPSQNVKAVGKTPYNLLLSRAHHRYGRDQLLGAYAPDAAAPGDPIAPYDARHKEEGVLVLHIVHALAQDARLETRACAVQLPWLAELAARLAARCGWTQWVDYWARVFPEVWRMSNDTGALGEEPDPPDASALLAAQMTARRSVQPKDLLGGRKEVSSHKLESLLPNAARLLRVFQAFGAQTNQSMSAEPLDQRRAAQVLGAMLEEQVRPTEFAGPLTPLAAPLFEALRMCQADPPSNLSGEALKLIERADLAASVNTSDLQWPNTFLPMSFVLEPSVPKQTVSARLNPVVAMLFSADLRLRDVLQMLQTRGRTLVMHPSVDTLNDAAAKETILRVLHGAQERIKATSIGRGMLHIATHLHNPTVKWRVPKLSFDLHVVPPPSVEYEYVPPRSEGGELDWPEFHNGAASALEIAVRGAPLESGWIFGQHGSEVSNRDAGFLLGIGLLGQLGGLGRVHVLKLLLPRTGGLAAVGLLLGLGASLTGSGDPAARHLIATHLPAFQPQGAHNLNLSMLEQAAALLGMALLFMGSDHAWTAKRMLDQIGSNEVRASQPHELEREAYSLSAAFGLGLVLLGKARRTGMRTGPDRFILTKLEQLMSGKLPSLFQDDANQSDLEWQVDTATTSSPAAIALGLIYLKSDCEEVAGAIPFPRSIAELESIRPDFLLIRTLARCLILWTSIRPSTDWIDSALPRFLAKLISSSRPGETAQLASLNIRAGAAFAIALKYAGSHDPQAYACLMKELNANLEKAKAEPTTFFQKIRQAALRSCADLLSISAAMVMAGSGDLPLLKHLRIAHGRTDAGFGSQMACHMALGLLFLGGGRFTLGTSDSAIAAMIMAFYPRFPSSSSDNRVHPQPCRHFWVLAVEARLLVAQDIESKQLLYLPIRIKSQGEEKVVQTPAQLPALHQIEEIQSASDAYWPTSLLLQSSQSDAQALLGRRCMFVKQRRVSTEVRSGRAERKRLLSAVNDPKFRLYLKEVGANKYYADAVLGAQIQSTIVPMQLEPVIPRSGPSSVLRSQISKASRAEQGAQDGAAQRKQRAAQNDLTSRTLVGPTDQQIDSLRAYIEHLDTPVAPPPSEIIEELGVPPLRVLKELRSLIQHARRSIALDEEKTSSILLSTLRHIIDGPAQNAELLAELLLYASR